MSDRFLARASLLLSIALALPACASSEDAAEPAAAESSGADTAGPVAEATPEETPPPEPAEPAPVEAPVEPAPTPPVPEGVTLVQRVLADESALATSIDPARGLVLVRYEEAGPQGGREVRTQSHVCGAQLARKAADVRRMLQRATEQAPPEEWTCSAAECVAPGMEWTPTIYIRFARSAEGTLVLTGVISVSEAALGEPWLTNARTYVERAIAAAEARPCPAPRPSR